MWIRSQDKLCLMKVEALPILSYDEKDNNIWSVIGIGKFQYTLGTYKSKERAIEVLDEIQDEISFYVGTIAQRVYEMPKE